MTPGLGSRLTGKLLRQFGSPEGIFRASVTELEACRLPSAPAHAIQSRQAHKDAEEELTRIRKLGCLLLNWDEPEYPQRLLEIYDPPPLLYVRGDPSVLNKHSISIVGTRRPTPYGNQVAERLDATSPSGVYDRQRDGARNRQLIASGRVPRLARRRSRRARDGR